LLETTHLAVELLGIEAHIIKVDEIEEILEYGVMSTPALVVNEKVVHSGRIAGKKEIMKLITPFIGNNSKQE
jgi:hypothetical protein